jgi:hypothetical protein
MYDTYTRGLTGSIPVLTTQKTIRRSFLTLQRMGFKSLNLKYKKTWVDIIQET